MNGLPTQPVRAPSPRDRVRLEWLIGALVAGPTGWIVQLVGGYALASRGCRPGDSPRLTPPAGGWGSEHLALLGLNLACLALTLFGGAVALRAWDRAGKTAYVARERTRFLAACGLIIAVAFALAIAFDTAWPFFIAPCWRFP